MYHAIVFRAHVFSFGRLLGADMYRVIPCVYSRKNACRKRSCLTSSCQHAAQVSTTCCLVMIVDPIE